MKDVSSFQRRQNGSETITAGTATWINRLQTVWTLFHWHTKKRYQRTAKHTTYWEAYQQMCIVNTWKKTHSIKNIPQTKISLFSLNSTLNPTRCRLALPFLPHSLSNAGLPMPGPASLDERLLNTAGSLVLDDASSPIPQLTDAIPAELVSCMPGDSTGPSCWTPFNASPFVHYYWYNNYNK